MSAHINIEKTLFCGQSFAWTYSHGFYEAVVQGRLVRFTEAAFDTEIASDPLLRHYFDLDWPYEEAETYLAKLDSHLERAIAAYRGLHILNQDRWEVVSSFILSQNNNIKRIRQLYQRLCQAYGTNVEGSHYAFPSPQQLADVSEQQLRELGLGYRAPYLLDAVRQHHLLDEMENMKYEEALELLQLIKGIGRKVGECILLFGYHRMEAFPMDRWMKRVMESRYPGMDSTYFAPYEGLAQQYLFLYELEDGGSI